MSKIFLTQERAEVRGSSLTRKTRGAYMSRKFR
jgi:hypothetical protein